MKTPNIKTYYQYIRLWFEFYKLSLKDKSLKENIKKSRDYYKPWGNISNKKFDDWFKDHGHLFPITKIKEIKDKPRNLPSTINLSIPLNQPVTILLRELKELITKKQKQTPPPNYEFTKGVIRGKTLYEILLIYTLYIEHNKPPINEDFVVQVINFFDGRKRSKWKPYIIGTFNPDHITFRNKGTDTTIRQLRRYIKKGESVCKSVSIGKFPGNSYLK